MEKNYTETLAAMKSALISTIYPVGAIYITTNSINPGELFGGTWEAYAEGRTIIGNGTIENRNFIAGATGGACAHLLTINELPSHTHTQEPHTHIGDNKSFSFWFNQFQHSTKNQPDKTFENNGCFNNNENLNVHLSQDNYVNDTDAIGNGSNWGHRKISVKWDDKPEIQKTTVTNNNTGGGMPHDILQPYIVTYIWHRVA